MFLKMKKVYVFCFTILMVMSLLITGCGSQKQGTQDSADQKSTDTTAAKKSFVIGLSNFSVGNSWRVQMVEEFKAEAEKLKADGVISNYIITDSNGDISKQIADMKDLITKKVDAIIVTAASPSALSPVCEEAESKGIKVISFDNYVDTDKVTSKVGIDDKEFGKVGAKFIVDKLGGKGNIIILNGIAGTSVNNNRFDGAKEIFAQNKDIKILGDANADWDYAKGKAAVENFLAAHPNIDGVWSQGGAMTQAAIDAFKAAGRPLVPMSGEANNGLLKVWKANAGKDKFDSIAPCCPTYVSASALDLAIDALNGKKVEKQTFIDLPIITKDTLDKYVRTDLPDSFWNLTKLSEDQVKKMFSK